jgi:hypothetical protein
MIFRIPDLDLLEIKFFDKPPEGGPFTPFNTSASQDSHEVIGMIWKTHSASNWKTTILKKQNIESHIIAMYIMYHIIHIYIEAMSRYDEWVIYIIAM